ncbi:MAG: DUF47 family protein, partial [Paraprevotella sp.]|nr:DUF47 family protein [Paraprevotella sp.]
WASYCWRLMDIVIKGDQLTHKILDELETTFITPLDREDLNSLASSMDDMIDGINSCAKRIHIYNPRSLGEGAKELCGFIVKEASYISKSVDELEAFRKNPLALREYCAELDEVENQADDVYDFFVKKLFEEEMDCIELIKVKEILQEMDRAIDAAANVGKILENVIVKYA